jgi:hypothetical protein
MRKPQENASTNRKSLGNSLTARTPLAKQLSIHANKITCKYVAITKEMLVVYVNELKPDD